MKKIPGITWRLLIAVTLVFSLAAVISTPTVAAAEPCPTLAAPVLVSPANGDLGTSTQPTFSWKPVTGASYYRVWVDGEQASDNIYPVAGANTISWQLDFAQPVCTYHEWYVRAYSDCTNTDSQIWSYNVGPMVGAVTGWEWTFPYNPIAVTEGPDPDNFDYKGPYNTNDRTSIMVLFDTDDLCGVDIDALTAANFRVNYTRADATGRLTAVTNEIPLSIIKGGEWEEDNYLCHNDTDYFLVFLTVRNPMYTGSTPTIQLTLTNPAGLVVVKQTIVADDGIAPIVNLAVTGSPYTYGDVTVTATASEPLSDIVIVTNNDYSVEHPSLPTADFFPPAIDEEADEYGGYCTEYLFEHENNSGYCIDWDGDGMTTLKWMHIAADANGNNTNTATYTYHNTQPQNPQESFIVEVYAHDFTWCDDCEEDDTDYWWRHQKWSSSSQFIDGSDTIELHLVEGWNLISFPRTPADPTLRGVFGDNVVSKVYTYKAGKWLGSIYNINTGLWASPTGFGKLETLEAGVGYWVYCIGAGEKQEMASDLMELWAWHEYYSHLEGPDGVLEPNDLDVYVSWTALQVPLQPAAVGAVTPPTYPLTAGWNLVGVPVQGSLDQYQLRWEWSNRFSNWMYRWAKDHVVHAPVTLASDFLSGLDWTHIYWYLPQFTVWQETFDYDMNRTYTFPSGYQVATPDTTGDVNRLAQWLGSMSAGISVFPQDMSLEALLEEAGFYLGDLSAIFTLDVLKNSQPVVIPGYGYWVYLEQAGPLIPGPASFSGLGLLLEEEITPTPTPTP